MGKWQMRLILALRSAAAVLLLILIFDPQISLNRVRSIPKRVAVVIDQSRSMASAWQGNSGELQTTISNMIHDLEEDHKIEIWGMNGDALELESLEFSKDLSVFSWSPSQRKSPGEEAVYSAAFVISDGHINGGRSPLDTPWSMSLPIYPVLPLEPRSNAVLKIIDLTYTLEEQAVDEVQVKVKTLQEGLVGKTATLVVWSETDQVLGEQTIRLNQKFTDISLPIRVFGDGTHTFKVSLTSENGRLKSEEQLDIQLDKTLKNVLLVSNGVDELHKFLLLNLPDSLYRIYPVLGTNSKQDDAYLNLSENDLDLIILNQPGIHVSSEPIIDLVRAGMEASCPVILFHDGIELLESDWSELMGIQQQKNNIPPGEYTAYWSHTAKDHPMYLGLLGREFSPDEMIKYPPIQHGEIELLYPGAILLVLGGGQKQVPALILNDSPPVAIFRGGNFWEWFFHPQARESFHNIWEYLLIYLEDIASFKPVTLKLPVQTAATGTYVTADILVKDMDNRAIPLAELRVWQEDEEGHQEELDISRIETGKYVCSLITKFPGEKLIVAEAYRFGELWGRDTSRIQLVAFNGEDQSVGVDGALLARLARRSGGEIVYAEQGELPIIPLKYFEERSSTQYRGVRSSGLFVILLTLLILEWILRRRSGLL